MSPYCSPYPAMESQPRAAALHWSRLYRGEAIQWDMSECMVFSLAAELGAATRDAAIPAKGDAAYLSDRLLRIIAPIRDRLANRLRWFRRPVSVDWDKLTGISRTVNLRRLCDRFQIVRVATPRRTRELAGESRFSSTDRCWPVICSRRGIHNDPPATGVARSWSSNTTHGQPRLELLSIRLLHGLTARARGSVANARFRQCRAADARSVRGIATFEDASG